MPLSFSFYFLIHILFLSITFFLASVLAFVTTLSCQNTPKIFCYLVLLKCVSFLQLNCIKHSFTIKKNKQYLMQEITFSHLMLLWTASISPAISRQEAQLFAFFTSFIRVHTLPPDTLLEQPSSYTKALWRCINISEHVRSTNVQKLTLCCICGLSSSVLECSSV